jgi:hypothetical protein
LFLRAKAHHTLLRVVVADSYQHPINNTAEIVLGNGIYAILKIRK